MLGLASDTRTGGDLLHVRNQSEQSNFAKPDGNKKFENQGFCIYCCFCFKEHADIADWDRKWRHYSMSGWRWVTDSHRHRCPSSGCLATVLRRRNWGTLVATGIASFCPSFVLAWPRRAAVREIHWFPVLVSSGCRSSCPQPFFKSHILSPDTRQSTPSLWLSRRWGPSL